MLYDLHEEPWIAPQSVSGLSRRRLPTLERPRLVFSAVPVAWDRWVEVWDEAIAGRPARPIISVRVLPATPS